MAQSVLVVHADLHVVAAQRYAPQLEGEAAAHEPSPSQNEAGVTLPVVQLAGPQIVEVPGTAPHERRSEPLHDDWQAPLPVHAVRTVPWTLPMTAEHLPTEPPTSHASHWPLQAESQQTPSTHLPDPHSLSVEHVVPRGLLQVPSPFELHFNPAPHELLEQQTASTQLPLVHSVPALQVTPRESLGTQLAALQ